MIATSGKIRPADGLEHRPWRLSVVWLTGLSSMFALSYEFSNWATSLRGHVPSIVFGWEHRIPFLAWTIVPYWSTDFLYALSLFICRTRQELNGHAKRLAIAQIISVSGFLLFPLRFSFDRPHAAGLFGWMFDVLAGFDMPFNQAPSLHLSLTVILWAKYSQHLSGSALRLMRLWLILTGVSTLTTYQHHFIDLPTGIWVGLLCLVLVPDAPTPVRSATGCARDRLRFGIAYLAGALVLVGLASRLAGAAWWLLWPAGALFIVAGIYFTGCAELFQKKYGVMPPAMVWLLAPYLGAAWLNSRLWTRKEPAANEITNGIWLGRLPRKIERSRLAIASIVDLTAELPMNTTGVVYRGVPMLDLAVPTLGQLDAAVNAIQELESSRPTLVCCALGYSRSAAALAAWMTASGKTRSVNESIALIRARRPKIELSRAQRARLDEWHYARSGK